MVGLMNVFLIRGFPKSQFLKFLVFGYFLAWYKINNFLAKKLSLTLGTVISKYFITLFICSQVLSEEETKLQCALAQLVLRRLFCWISQVWKVWKLPLWEPSLSSPRWIGSSCEWSPSLWCIQSRLLIQIETGRGGQLQMNTISITTQRN